MAEETEENVTVYARVPWTDHRTGNEVGVGDSVQCPDSVADWLVRAGLVTRQDKAEPSPASGQQPDGSQVPDVHPPADGDESHPKPHTRHRTPKA